MRDAVDLVNRVAGDGLNALHSLLQPQSPHKFGSGRGKKPLTHIVSHIPFTLRAHHIDPPAILSELVSEELAEAVDH